MTQQRISPRQFSLLQRGLQWMEDRGHGPTASVIGACNWAGIKPPEPYVPMEVIVDPALSEQDASRGLMVEMEQ